MMVILLQYINVLKQVVHLQFTQCCMSIIPRQSPEKINTHTNLCIHTHMHIFLFSPLYTPKDSSIHRMPWTYLFHGV